MVSLWRYPLWEVADFVRMPKRSREGLVLGFKKKRELPQGIDTNLAVAEFFLAKLSRQ